MKNQKKCMNTDGDVIIYMIVLYFRFDLGLDIWAGSKLKLCKM